MMYRLFNRLSFTRFSDAVLQAFAMSASALQNLVLPVRAVPALGLAAAFTVGLPEALAADRLFPFYSVDQTLQSIAVHHYGLRQQILKQELKALETSASSYCRGKSTMAEVQTQHARSYEAWLELSAVVWGPLLKDNTARQVDFRPLRINLLERAVAKAPKTQSDMATVGSPAKGFPALEYLLHGEPAKPATAQCNYLQAVVRDIAVVIEPLDFSVAGAGTVENPDAGNTGDNKGLQLYFNQLIGAVHILGWEHIEKPLLKAREQSPAKSPASGMATAGAWHALPSLPAQAQWSARWKSIDGLLALDAGLPANQVPDPTQHSLPLEAYIRGLGQLALADELVQKTRQVRAAIQSARPAQLDSVQPAVTALKNLKAFLERDVAQGLKVAIQFSSSDGD